MSPLALHVRKPVQTRILIARLKRTANWLRVQGLEDRVWQEKAEAVEAALVRLDAYLTKHGDES